MTKQLEEAYQLCITQKFNSNSALWRLIESLYNAVHKLVSSSEGSENKLPPEDEWLTCEEMERKYPILVAKTIRSMSRVIRPEEGIWKEQGKTFLVNPFKFFRYHYHIESCYRIRSRLHEYNNFDFNFETKGLVNGQENKEASDGNKEAR